MWDLKKHIWPKHKEPIPTGKFNHQNKLVTGPEEIKKHSLLKNIVKDFDLGQPIQILNTCMKLKVKFLKLS